MTASLLTAFAPTGRLRASINLGNPILANLAPITGQPVGISIDLADMKKCYEYAQAQNEAQG